MTDIQSNEILIVDDQPANLRILAAALEQADYNVLVATSGAAALHSASSNLPSLILLDVVMPEMDGYEVCRRLKADPVTAQIPVVFLSAEDENESVLQGFRAGGLDYITKPFENEEVLVRVRTHMEISRLARQLQQRNDELQAANQQLRDEISERKRAHARLDSISQLEASVVEGFVGASPAIVQLHNDVRQLQGATSTSVLIHGESGTGKELIARALHFGGSRKRGPFVPVNASAVSQELAESQFFGHVKGAFTGAQADHKGYFEQADGGTLFLDEIGDMPGELQAKLLRVLEEGTVRPVGATQERHVDVRVVAATHMDLSAQISGGGGSSSFRRDLFFRLAHFTVTVPPLRERTEDIPLLADHFLDTLSAEMGQPRPTLSVHALVRLQNYAFPGNVREFRNMMEHALLKCDGDSIEPEHLHFLELSASPSTTPVVDVAGAVAQDEEVLIAFVRVKGGINNPTCRQLLQVDARRASYLLDKLCKAGLLVRQGAKRYARYQLAE